MFDNIERTHFSPARRQALIAGYWIAAIKSPDANAVFSMSIFS
jgi:hypothetical protein